VKYVKGKLNFDGLLTSVILRRGGRVDL